MFTRIRSRRRSAPTDDTSPFDDGPLAFEADGDELAPLPRPVTTGQEPEAPPSIDEIARRADVALESVVRTLRGEPVSQTAGESVVAVLQEIERERPGSLARLIHLRNPSVMPEASTEIELQSPATPAGITTELEGLESTMRLHQADRVQDIAVMVDLLRTRWRTADERLARIERLASSE